jgi:Tfp pilus assembly protein PilO
MEITTIITIVKKNKNKLVNIAIIILALIIAAQISKKQTKDMEALVAQSNVEIKKNKVLGDISRLEKKINAYKNLLAEKDPNLTINSIGNIAKETGVNITSIKPEPQQRYPDYIKAPFSLSISTSDYHALGDFISRLETNENVCIVDYIGIKSESPSGALTVNLRVSSVTFMD